jgi:hypothetical protein
MTVDGMFCMTGAVPNRAVVDKIGANTHIKGPVRRERSIGPRLSDRAACSVNSYVVDSRCRRTPHPTPAKPADAISLISCVHGHPHKRDLPADGWLHGLRPPRLGATYEFMQTTRQSS